MRSRIITGVLHNFLGTYTSRYSDCGGYWLFGMLVGEVGELRINLLAPQEGARGHAPLAAAIQLAAQKFRDQMDKAGLAASSVREAYLDVTRLPEAKQGFVNGRRCDGYAVRFAVRVVSNTGASCKREISIFVAPHDSKIERRSARAS